MRLLRPIAPSDRAAVLDLNERHVELLSPLTPERLDQLVEWSATAAVIDVDGEFAGFVLAFGVGSAYDGDNFAWFAERYPASCYLDRVVVHDGFRRRGVANWVYDELEAACPHPAFALEVNVDPPNTASLAFHRARGYAEVGRRVSHGHTVSLQVKTLR